MPLAEPKRGHGRGLPDFVSRDTRFGSRKGVNQIYNYVRLSDRIATGGQPTETEFLSVKEAGFRAVVNLALTSSDNALEDESTVGRPLGMNYVHIPVAFEAPRSEDYRRFVKAMADFSDISVFVHCAANKRVSAFFWL